MSCGGRGRDGTTGAEGLLLRGDGGHLELLQWARANGCPWDESTALEAARWGRTRLLPWAIANGCPWDRETLIGEAYDPVAVASCLPK